jgi:hypothetical protein
MYNPLSDKGIKDLSTAIESADRDLMPFRRYSFQSIQQYAGKHYGANEDSQMGQVPINLLQLAVEIYVQSIVPTIPKYLTRSQGFSLDRPAMLLEMALNHVSKEMDMAQVYQRAVMNAMFGMGIVKTGTAPIDRGTLIDANQPYAESVSLSDWVHDTRARTFEEASFCGNVFRLPYDVFQECGLYKNTDKVKPRDVLVDKEGNEYSYTDLSEYRSSTEDYREMVELIEIYLPWDNIVVTLPANGDAYNLRDIEWQGGERGPYELLRFQSVPDNIMPVPPTSAWLDIHELTNNILTKSANQSRRQKTVVAYGVNGKEDAQRIQKANDGDLVGVVDPSQLREVAFGGPDQSNQSMLFTLRDMYSWQAGNLDALGGLSAQSATLGQDQLLGASANKRLEKMRQEFYTFAEHVGENIAKELWYDPNIEIPMIKRYPNSGIEIPVQFDEAEKEGDFFDYNIEVDPYSLHHQSPTQRLQSLSQIMQQFVAPMMPFMQQQGATVNTRELFNLVARYSNMEELNKIIAYQDQVPPDDAIKPQQLSSPTTRETIRRNVSTSGTREGRDHVMAQTLMGGKPQEKERAAATRI